MIKNRLYTSWSSTISETWRSTYNFNLIIKSLSRLMKKVLREALNNKNHINCRLNTMNSLILRNLCDEDGKLTQEGKVVALAILSLKKQTEALSININEIEYRKNLPKINPINYLSNFYDYTNPEHYKAIVSSEILKCKIYPEITIKKLLIKHDNYNIVCFDEGSTIHTLLSCMTFNVVHKAWKDYYQIQYKNNKNINDRYFNDDKYITYTFGVSLNSIRYLSLVKNKAYFYKNLVKELLHNAKTVRKNDIENAFIKIQEIHSDNLNDSSQNNCTKLSIILSLYDALGKNLLNKILKIYLSDPSAFGQGWPDLTTIDKNNIVKLLEVKTSDKLHISQIITFQEISKYLPIEIIKVID